MMLQAKNLAALPGIRHAFFTREGGVSEGIYESLNAGVGSDDDPAKVVENRARMAKAVGVAPERFLTAYQIHSPTVVVAETPWTSETRPKADAIVTRVPDLAIGVSTADCGPVLFADAKAGVIGAAHAGWRGAFDGVLENTVAAMATLGADPARIVAVLGPCIAQASYEVGPEFMARFTDRDPAYALYFTEPKANGHVHFDLPAFVGDRLRSAGVGTVIVEGSDTCTADTQFFSYRRSVLRSERDYGRQLSAIVLS